MKKLLLTLAAIPAATMAVEANAQSVNVEANLQNRIMNLEQRLSAGLQAGVFTTSERNTLVNQLNQLRGMYNSYAMNGISRAERQTLQTRIRSLRDQMRMAGGNGWANRYGWNDRDLDVYGNVYGQTYGNAYGQSYGGVTYDQYGRPIQTMRYDQYGRPIGSVTYDQYGRPVQNGYYGQGGPYEPVYTPRSSNGGIGNILGGVLGGGGGGGILGNILGNGGLSVGSIITSTIANALGRGSSYGYQDRSNVYFRSDGQRVYEIDARTNQVIRIHPLR